MTNEERIKSYRDIAKDYYSKILQVIEAKKEVQTKEKLNDMKSTSSLYSGIIFIGGTALGTIIGAATFAPFLASLGVSALVRIFILLTLSAQFMNVSKSPLILGSTLSKMPL